MIYRGRLMHLLLPFSVQLMVSLWCYTAGYDQLPAADWLLAAHTDAWVTITTTIVIPCIKQMQKMQVPASFVDTLLWLPSKAINKKYIAYEEIGALNFIKCSDIRAADQVFEAVEKQ